MSKVAEDGRETYALLLPKGEVLAPQPRHATWDRVVGLSTTGFLVENFRLTSHEGEAIVASHALPESACLRFYDRVPSLPPFISACFTCLGHEFCKLTRRVALSITTVRSLSWHGSRDHRLNVVSTKNVASVAIFDPIESRKLLKGRSKVPRVYEFLPRLRHGYRVRF